MTRPMRSSAGSPRYAAQLSEKNALGANRREEYKKVAEIFLKCQDMDEAHRMAAMVFGLEKPLHLRAGLGPGYGQHEPERVCRAGRGADPEAESPYIPRTVRKDIYSGCFPGKAADEEAGAGADAGQTGKKLSELEQGGRIDFERLPVIEPRVREILLKWLSDALEDGGYSARTEDGRNFTLDMTHADERCVGALPGRQFYHAETEHCISGRGLVMRELEILLNRRWVLKSEDRGAVLQNTGFHF